jgi:hypothetical protein
VLAQEPGLEFIGAQYIADGEIVRAIVSYFVGTASQGTTMADDDLVGVEQAGNLHRNFFPAPWRTLDARSFGHIGSHGDRNATKKLNSLGDGIDNF